MPEPRDPAEAGRPTVGDVLEFVPDAMIGVDAGGLIVLCNAQAAQVFGYSREELIGTKIEQLVAAESAVRHARLRAGYIAGPRTRRMGSAEAPLTARRRDGSEFPVEVSLSWFEGLHDGEGVALAAVRDVSDRVRAEAVTRRLRDEFQRSRKLESLGQLAAGVAHDFNNLLAVIVNFAELAAGAVAPNSPLAKDVSEIRRAAERGRALTRKLLIVGGRDVGRAEQLDLAAMLTSLRPLLLSVVGEHVDLRFELSATRLLLADLAQMEQILVNLVVNARDAMPQGGTLVVRTGDVDVGAGEARGGDALPPGRYVALTVRDTGIGMTAQVLDAAVDPFFTTKPTGQGTGLGLSTVYGIVREMHGSLALESEVGAGTQITILLPAHQGAPDAEPGEPER